MKTPVRLTSAQMGILNHLKHFGSSSAKQIASALRVTPVAVRNHMATLEKARLVGVTPDRHRTGRPTNIYSLTEEARTFFPNDYEGFIAGFIRAIVELDGEAKLESIFGRMQMNTSSQNAPRMNGKDFEGRVAEMARILSDAGYMAEWRQLGENTFELTERNCSILQVAAQCPQVCACELAVIRQLLGASVERQQHIIAGDSVCRYTIQRPSSPAKKKALTRRQYVRENN